MNEYTVKVIQRGQPDRTFRTYARSYSEARFHVKAANSFWDLDRYKVRVVEIKGKGADASEGVVIEL